jgi:acyl carrier protein
MQFGHARLPVSGTLRQKCGPRAFVDVAAACPSELPVMRVRRLLFNDRSHPQPSGCHVADRIDEIAALIRRIGGIAHLDPDEDFFEAGFESINALELLLELESTYSVTVSDEAFVSCRTVRAIDELVSALLPGGQTA